MAELVPLPPFEDFYEAIHGWPPLPWQARLAHHVGPDGAWPAEVGVPTGLGKTSALDVAVWALAAQADRPPAERTAPTRTWWLVNRRLLVDSTADHATRLAALLDDPEAAPAVRAVSVRLRAVRARGLEGPALQVVKLRGGVAVDRPIDPSAPAVILSTLPQYGSRLLFRGYGSSRSMRPVDAALAGTDTLVLVDEAHLAHHLVALFGPVRECDPAPDSPLPERRMRPVVVSLTATGDAAAERFDLDADDLAHPIVRQRIHAPKPTRVEVAAPRADVAQELADAANELIGAAPRPLSTVVFANTPSVARDAAERLARSLAGTEHDLVVLTGLMREREARAARDHVLDPVVGAASQRPDRTRDRHLVVVATQTLEVGADVDFDRLVTEGCGVRALTQRLGRLNRLGRTPDAAATYVHVVPCGGQEEWAVYGTEPREVLERLRESATDDVVDLRVARVAEVLGAPGDDPGRGPELLPAILDEWTKTTTPPPGEAPVEPYFSGIARPDQRVSVLWRAHVPTSGDRLWPPPSPDEAIEVPLGELRRWLELRDAEELARLGPDQVTVEWIPGGAVRPGDVAVLAADAGGYDDHGWHAPSRATVLDLSVERAGVPVDAEALARLVRADGLAAAVSAAVDPPDDDDTRAAEAVDRLRQLLRTAEPVVGSTEEWRSWLDATEAELVLVAGEVPRFERPARAVDARVDELDEVSLSDAAVHLDAHGASVGEVSRRIGEAIGIADPVLSAVERAGRFHDVGKADARFQRWLDPSKLASGPVAKSARPRHRWRADRVASGWPEGGRHEALSARLVASALAEQPDPLGELVVHLVMSHHGHGRPLLVPVPDMGALPVRVEIDGRMVEACADLSLVDWEQPDRFWTLNERYGRWGLALLEAVVRQADHLVSAGSGGVL